MTTAGTPESPRRPPTKALAFYLPQYHPIPENDEWWGKGFTEWTNVTKARPAYPGHYQPHVPGELGYYDLRVPEVREAQAALAREHGVSGFIYYHYWFNGRQLLQRPFDEVLASGSPDFPFALCWANEEWTRNWDGMSGRVLIPQGHSAEDDIAHIRWLAKAFADDRYIKIDGKPLVLIYRPAKLPDAKATAERWRSEAQRLGFPDLYLCWVDGWGRPEGSPEKHGFDATVGFVPLSRERMYAPVKTMRNHRIYDYVASFETQMEIFRPTWKHLPAVMVGWDNTARYPQSAMIFEGATPEHYQRWLEMTVQSLADVRAEENYLVIVAWNEWAEGNHLEPDRRFGRAFLEATKAVLAPPIGVPVVPRAAQIIEPSGAGTAAGESPPPAARGSWLVGDSVVANLAELVALHRDGNLRPVVNLSAGADHRTTAKLVDRLPMLTLEVDADAVRQLKVAGFDAVQCDITDPRALGRALDGIDDVGTLVLCNVLEHVAQPHRLLATLSSWALAHGSVELFVVVRNTGHVDNAVQLLFGDWNSTTGGADQGPNRLFTGRSLAHMVQRCGWQVLARNDAHVVESVAYDSVLYDQLPQEMIGALRVVAETYNPYWSVSQFIWGLTPSSVERFPATLREATEDDPMSARWSDTDKEKTVVENYLESVGLVASETNRRAVALERRPNSLIKRSLLKVVNSNPRSAAAYRKTRRWLA